MSGAKRACTTRAGAGLSSQEQEPADSMMTIERQVEYLRGRPLMTGKTSAVVGSIIKQRAGAGGGIDSTVRSRAAAAVEEAARPSSSVSEAPFEMGVPAVPPPWVAQLFVDLDSRVSVIVKAALQPLEGQVKSLEEDMRELGPPSKGSAL
ncbi:hypothetical protein CJ030_MR4G023077 [Morella rubra]|uniref:Uncharacterized protein n=1 Tax=Morella rubra TaxID=262757 RepID=A0A6A1W131_9ROSI|nr:hypothetical protein CJ030_MR4G023077 [Morella rubra]